MLIKKPLKKYVKSLRLKSKSRRLLSKPRKPKMAVNCQAKSQSTIKNKMIELLSPQKNSSRTILQMKPMKKLVGKGVLLLAKRKEERKRRRRKIKGSDAALIAKQLS